MNKILSGELLHCGSSVVNIKVIKVRGGDHRGELKRIVVIMAGVRHGEKGQVKLQYTMGEVDMSASLRARLQDRIYTTKKSVDWHGLSVRLCVYSGNVS